MLHEMLIVAVDNPQAPMPYDYSAAKVVEDQVKVMGDTGDLDPGNLMRSMSHLRRERI
jgi:hypothetical protein